MAKITAVSDSGPLMALAKLGVLSKVFSLYPTLTISETEISLDMLSELHQGEVETIRIALQLSADYLFLDDFYARQVADANRQKMSATTTVKGTLGILVEQYQKKLIYNRFGEHSKDYTIPVTAFIIHELET